MSDLAALRQRLVARPFERCPGCGLNRGRKQHFRVICEHPWHDVEAAFAQGVDAALAALEQVGQVSPDWDGYPQFSGITPDDGRGNHVTCDVYRITPDTEGEGRQ